MSATPSATHKSRQSKTGPIPVVRRAGAISKNRRVLISRGVDTGTVDIGASLPDSVGSYEPEMILKVRRRRNEHVAWIDADFVPR